MSVPPHIMWAACGKQLLCTRVTVPLDWSRPKARQISIAVIRHLASQPRRRIGAIFFNPGGPGVSGVDTLKAQGGYFDSLGMGRFDVVSWDPRGTGASTHVRCFANKASLANFWDHLGFPASAAASRAYVRKTVGFARRCGEVSGSLLRYISTAETARDLDDLRQLLGESQLNYLGWSYGSFLGTTYANMFPRRVRAMVLDGIVDPIRYTVGRAASLANTETDSDLVFKTFELLCQQSGPSRCALAGEGSVAPGIDRLFARLRRGPISAPSAPGSKLTYGDLLTALFLSVRDTAEWPQLAKDLQAAEAGNGSALEIVALKLRSPSGYGLLVPAVAIGCADSPAMQPPQASSEVIDRLTDISFIYGPLLGWSLWAPCASWPAASASRYIGPWNAATKNPVLIIGTRFDPNTPFVNARRLERLLGNAILLTHDGFGHVSISDPSACVERVQRRYFVSLTIPDRGTMCSSNHLPFDPDFGKRPKALDGPRSAGSAHGVAEPLPMLRTI
jgi:pimeloyl-ACP methyl ester carboxylesterase